MTNDLGQYYNSAYPQLRYVKSIPMGVAYQVGCAYCNNEWITDNPTTDLKEVKCDKCHEK